MTAGQKRVGILIAAAVLVLAAVVGLVGATRLVSIVAISVIAVGAIVLIAWRIVVRRRTKVIFGFYVAANEILLDEDRSRYHFEIAQVIQTGQKVMRSMPDAPALSRFALGALYYAVGDYNGAAEHLAIAAEEDVLKESRHVLPSRQLRRYVASLRRIERRPKLYAKINSAVASLQRMQQERAARLLAVSQQQLKRVVEAYENEVADQPRALRNDFPITTTRSLKSISAPPTISEVLNEIYQEEPKAS